MLGTHTAIRNHSRSTMPVESVRLDAVALWRTHTHTHTHTLATWSPFLGHVGCHLQKAGGWGKDANVRRMVGFATKRTGSDFELSTWVFMSSPVCGLHDHPNESIAKHHSPRPIVPRRTEWTEKLVIVQSSSFMCLTTNTSVKHALTKKKHQFAVGKS